MENIISLRSPLFSLYCSQIQVIDKMVVLRGCVELGAGQNLQSGAQVPDVGDQSQPSQVKDGVYG